MRERLKRAASARLRSALDAPDLESQLRDMRAEVAALRARCEQLTDRVRDDSLGDWAPGPALIERILALERWLEYHPPPSTPISVVLPTLDRAAMLASAIGSVQAQTHANWELIVVDDGGRDETTQLLATFDDERIRSVSSEGLGPPGARNRGLDLANGEIVAYLDDDNFMLPMWLAALAWAFERHPDVDVVYGGRVLEDESMFGSPARLPRVLLAEWDRAALERANFTDANVIAHRAAVAGARWDAELSGVSDWDLVLRLTARKPPLALPALAVLYRTTAQKKHSASPRFSDSYATLVERLAHRQAAGS
jgi:glycosyltransferase involved in cell wall biosynthesis